MKIVKIKTVSEGDALIKLHEEYHEFMRSKSKQNDLEEGFDIIQSVFSVFNAKGYTGDEIRSHMKLHYQKLEQRHEEGRINIEECSEY